MQQLLNDVRYGLRMLLKAPGANATVFLALSLGIGLSTLVFSMINGAVLPTLPVKDGDRIVRIERVDQAARTADDYGTWVARQRSFEEMGAVEAGTATLAIEGSVTEPFSSAAITPSVHALLSEEPVLGRPFTPEDAAPGAPAVALIGEKIWRDRLDSDPAVVGRIIRIDGQPVEIAGVMAEGFGFPWDQQVWTPLNPDPLLRGRAVLAGSQERVSVVGRLREGVSMRAASEELSALAREIDAGIPGTDAAASRVRVASYTDLFSESGQSASLAVLMLAVALLVLLVASANAANVLLAQAMSRRREIAVRMALGASRLRIKAQHLTEASLLAVLGGAGGVAIAVVGARYAEAAMPAGMPYWVTFGLDWRVLGFVVVVALLAALMAGLIPAVQASRSNMHEVIKDDSRGSSSFSLGRLMRRLVGVEVALSVILLVLAGLFIQSASNFGATEFAFAPEEVYTASVELPAVKYGEAPTRLRFAEQLLREIDALPEAADVALATALPGIGAAAVVPMDVESGAEGGSSGVRARSIVVTPGFFDVFRAPVATGRDFNSGDGAGSLPVAIVNEAFATANFPEGAVNQRIRLGGAEGSWLTIVGVTPDLMANGLSDDIPDAVYLPLAQNPGSSLRIIARPQADFMSLTSPIRGVVSSLDPDVALNDVLPHGEVIGLANSQYTWFSLLFLVSGGIALFLAAIGLYGVMAFWVGQRTREIGVRIAIGGQRGDIIGLVLRQGMVQISVGLVAGGLLALAAAQFLRFALFGVEPFDPTVYAGVLLVLLTAGWIGCCLPALRATRIQPIEALIG